MKNITAFLLTLSIIFSARGQVAPTLVKDINPTFTSNNEQGSHSVEASGSFVYYSIGGETTGTELWQSDGTEAGSHMLKDINPGPASSGISHLKDVNGTLFFAATDGTHGRQLWKSDGTSAGTQMVKVIQDAYFADNLFINLNGTLYFNLHTPDYGTELWKSDGTAEGTMLAFDLAPGYSDARSSAFTVIGNYIYFSAKPTGGSSQAYRTDGTVAGTKQLTSESGDLDGGDINPTRYHGANGKVYFTTGHFNEYSKLWVTDGTAANTKRLKLEINDDRFPNELAVLNGVLYFTDNFYSNSLWKLDANDQAIRVKRFENAIDDEIYASNLFAYNGALYFYAWDAVHGKELWKSDGTTDGTAFFKEFIPGAANTYGGPTEFFGVANNKLFFNVGDAALWSTDGTAEGTTLALNAYVTYSSGADISRYAALPGALYFVFTHYTFGLELWKSDGSAAGTGIVKDAIKLFDPANISKPFAYKGKSFFVANDGTGSKIWTTDGTPGGTTVFKDLNSAAAHDFTEIDGILYFFGWNGTGDVLWKTDGTPEGTVIVKSGIGSTQFINKVGDKIMFHSSDGNNSSIWTTDGTPEGTKQLEIKDGEEVVSVQRFLLVTNNRYYFSGTTSPHPESLWSTDGTPEGTFAYHEVTTTGNYGLQAMSNMVEQNGSVYFITYDIQGSDRFWKVDGTAGGITLLKELCSACNILGFGVVAHGSDLYFISPDASGKFWLWRSDGTQDGTKTFFGPDGSVPYDFYFSETKLFVETAAARATPIVGKLYAIGTDDNATMLTNYVDDRWGNYDVTPMVFNDKFYFFASPDSAGQELFVSDGTVAGTKLVRDLLQGSLSGKPHGLAIQNNSLYFLANPGAINDQLWKVDEACGALLVTTGSAYFSDFFVVNSKMLLRGTDDVNGEALFAYDLSSEPDLNCDPPEVVTAVEEKSVFSVYPNPTTGNVVVDRDEKGLAALSLTDILGRKVYSATFMDLQLRLTFEGVARGFYLLHYASGSTSKVVKLEIK